LVPCADLASSAAEKTASAKRPELSVRPRSIRALLALSLAIAAHTASGAPSPAAGAAPPAATDDAVTTARETFAAAEKDEDAEQWASALTKLRQVAAVRLTAGVRYHVALCEEHLGQLVQSLADYREAERQARADGARDVAKLVGPRIADVSSRVARVALRVLPATGGIVATIDGQPCADPICSGEVPVDPGPHRIEARAADRLPAATNVTLTERETAAVDLVLQPMPPAAPATQPASPPAPRTTASPSRTASLLAGAGALVLAAGGVVAFIAAGDEVTSAIRSCRALVTAAPGACDGQKNTVRALDWTAAGAWAGAASLATIAVLTWRPHGEAAPAASASVRVGPRSIAIAGEF
jgi:hypothetical protein